nr:sensor histidine kinase [uncultured Pseudomonas sp.]
MLPRLNLTQRHCSRKAVVRWMTAALGVASLSANVVLHVKALPMPIGLVLLQVAALLGAAWQWRQWGRLISLRPAELAECILKVQERERQRLSRELHDDIGQLLTAAKLQLDWLQRRLPSELMSHASALRNTLDEALNSVRDVAALLNPRQLASLGLEASLRDHLLRTLNDSDVQWSLECKQRLTGISDDISMAAFRITQEAVTNMLRHAGARNLRVQLQRTPDGLALTIEDDGCGFMPSSDPAAAGQRGMAGMHERARALHGSLSVHSQPGRGARIEAMLPWPARTQARARTFASHDL